MGKTNEFEDIRPYEGEEVQNALERIRKDPRTAKVLEYLFPEVPWEKNEELLKAARNTYDFQRDFMHKAIRRILERSSDGLSYEGFKGLGAQSAHLFIANHRDIFLDSGILEILLFEHGIETSEITFGSNLMKDQFLRDIGKVNKMFTVHREGSRRERYEKSRRLSAYIRHSITEKGNSVWIAQRDGRTKNGQDRTHPGVLKMLCGSGSGDIEDKLRELDILPLSISYEFEPCDKFKVKELYCTEKLQKEYVKEEGEDLENIVAGVTEPKGRVHMAVCPPITEELPALEGIEGDGAKLAELAKIIDTSIHEHYKLWPSNYFAYDELFGTRKYQDRYGGADTEKLIERMERVLSELEGERETLRELFLRIYANPVIDSPSA